MNIDLRQIGASMSASRMRVPMSNRAKFDIESKDYFEAIREAVEAGDGERAEALLTKWTDDRLWWLTNSPGCHVAPPSLVRKPNETNDEYLDRCYAAGGFHYA